MLSKGCEDERDDQEGCRCSGPGECSRYPLLLPEGADLSFWLRCSGQSISLRKAEAFRAEMDRKEAELRGPFSEKEPGDICEWRGPRSGTKDCGT